MCLLEIVDMFIPASLMFKDQFDSYSSSSSCNLEEPMWQLYTWTNDDSVYKNIKSDMIFIHLIRIKKMILFVIFAIPMFVLRLDSSALVVLAELWFCRQMSLATMTGRHSNIVRRLSGRATQSSSCSKSNCHLDLRIWHTSLCPVKSVRHG